jgi:hypothetical protein
MERRGARNRLDSSVAGLNHDSSTGVKACPKAMSLFQAVAVPHRWSMEMTAPDVATSPPRNDRADRHERVDVSEEIQNARVWAAVL